MPASPNPRIILFAIAALTLACNVEPQRAPAIGEAYAGPSSLTLYKDIDPKSPAVATVHHGDLLQITARHRRWYKVRSPKGVEGWTDDTGLLDRDQMNRIRAMSKETAGLPSQGLATTFGTLRVHAEPNRQAVSFVQVVEGEKFDVIAHRVVARAPLPKRELIVPAPKPARKTRKENSRLPPPPNPVPPAPPEDWVALSKERSQIPEENLPPAASDDWTLIRTHSGQSGWVLTSRLYLTIPDEVAQYAEGHRITSYFSSGKSATATYRKTSGSGPPPNRSAKITISTAIAYSPGASATTATRPRTSKGAKSASSQCWQRPVSSPSASKSPPASASANSTRCWAMPCALPARRHARRITESKRMPREPRTS